MHRSWTAVLALALTVPLAIGCGDDDGDDDDDVVADAATGTPDAAAGTPDAAPTADTGPTPDAGPTPDGNAATCTQPALAPQDDSSIAGVSDIVISEVSIDGDVVELYNNTASDIDLTGLTGYVWCTFGSYPLVTADAVTVPAKGYATIPWPLSIGTNASGELVLYANSFYTNASSVLDYVCWGSGGTIRKQTACMAGKWDAVTTCAEYASIPCAPAIPAGGSIQRKVSVTGDVSSDYEALATPTPETGCSTE